MSNERSHSAVRNLRTLFESKSTEGNPETRGRSSSGIGSDKENSRPRSKIRASFVAVNPMAEAAGMSELKQEASNGQRRDGFSESEIVDGGVEEGKKTATVADEQARRELDSDVKETIPESGIDSATSTPGVDTIKKPSEVIPKQDSPAANPDKPTTGAEEEPGEMKPADPTSQDAVSGGKALAVVTEAIKHMASTETKKNQSRANGKPTSISTKAPTKPAAGSIKSPVDQPKTPSAAPPSAARIESPKPATKLPSKKPSRSSLAAPTAASVARAAAAAEKMGPASTGKNSPPSKSKSRDVTKPLDISARLTAPTAAFRAKHEQTPLPETASIPNHPKPTSSAKPNPRQSLGGGQRPTSRVSLGASSRKPPPPPDGSFLERMTRPTAASQNRAQEKVETRSPQRPASKPAASLAKPKPSGAAKSAARVSVGGPSDVDTTAIDEAALVEDASVPTEGLAEETREAIAPTFDPALDTAVAAPPEAPVSTGNETPLASAAETDDAGLEATPAFKTDETIR